MPKTTGFSQQALRRYVPQIDNQYNPHHDTNMEQLDYNNQMIHAIRTTTSNDTESTTNGDSQYEYTIALLRAILKRPSENQGIHNKHVTFNPNIDYQYINNTPRCESPIYNEEDSPINDNKNDKTTNETISTGRINLLTIPTPRENRPTTYSEDDINNIPDIVDAPNSMNFNLNDAQLAYLNALYGNYHTDKSRQISLVDTGASFSFMHTDIFERLPYYEEYIKHTKPLKIRTGCNNILKDIAKIIILPFTFKDSNDDYHTVSSIFLVVSVISNEVFLGNDILMRSELFSDINKNTIAYNNPNTKKQYKIPITWRKTTPHIKLLANYPFELPPFTSLKVLTKPSSEPPQRPMIITNESEDNDNEQQNTIHITNMQITPTPNNPLPIIITNNSGNYMRMEQDDELASLVDTQDQTQYAHITNVTAEQYTSKKHDDDVLSINQHQHWYENEPPPDQTWQNDIPPPIKDYETGKTREELDAINYVRRQLNDDASMNDQEKSEELETFKKTGKYQHSVTKVIEKNTKLSELKKDDKKRLTPQQCVDSLNLDHFEPETRTKIKTIFMKYESVLAKSEFDIPRAKGILADPIIRQEYVNKCMLVKYKSINLNIRDEVQEILSNMCDAGVIEETDEPTPFLSNLLVAKKRNGKLRLLYDCRPSNMAIVNIPSTFTPKEDITYILGNAARVSSIDLTNSYFQIGIHPDKRSLFSFCDAYGKRYRYCVLAQGFHSSPFYLQTLLVKCFKGLENNVKYYADDIFIHTNKDQSLDDHLNIIEEVLRRLQKFNLKIKCSKVEIDPPCINILGITRERNGKYRIPKDKACILANWPEPTTVEELKSYICTANYFNPHIYDFWNIVLPLQEQTKEHTNNPKITLSKASKTAFEKLKKATANHIEISAPNLDKEFYISSDSSGFASAALLYQVIDNVVHYLGAASRLYTKQERKYSTIKLEIMALLYAFSKWDYILRYSRHVINALTDAKGILYIKNGKDTTNMLYRISQVISHYDMRIMHTSGNPKPANSTMHYNKSRSHWLPDIISRTLKPKKLENYKPVSEDELDQLMQLLVLKEGYTITPQQLQKFMREPGLPSPSRGPQGKRTSKVKVNPTNIQPITKPTKKKHPPQFVNTHKYYPNQIKDNENNLTDYTKSGTKQPDTTPEQTTANMTISPTPTIQQKHTTPKSDQMKPIQIFPTKEEAKDYTYYRYDDDDIPCHSLNIIRLLLEYEHKPDPNRTKQNDPTPDQQEIPPTEEEEELIQEAKTITTNDITEQLIINSKLIQDGMIALNVLLEAQLTDPLICNIKAKNPLPEHYSIKNEYLLHNTNGQDKFVIPQSLFTIIQNSLHHQIWGRHQPADKMYQILTKHFYLPGLMAILKRIVSACMICNTTKLQNTKRQVFGKKLLPLANREMWMADIGGGYEDGNTKYFIIFVDALTLFSVSVAISNKNTETLLNAFTTHIINIFGTPNYFYSDNEPAFDSNEFKNYCISENIEIMHAAPYASFSNGNCEKQIKLAKDIVRAYTRSTGLSYKTVLPDITRSLNNRILTSSKDLTPAKLMFGSNLHPQLLTSSTNYTDPNEYLENFINQMEENTKRHRQRRIDNAERQRKYHDRSRKDITFKVGEHVYYRSFQIPETKGALVNKWNGPATIEILHANGRTATISDYDQNTRRVVHTHHLKHYDTNGQPTTAPVHLEDRAVRLLQQHTNTKPNEVNHTPITRSATTTRTTPDTPQTPPDTMEMQENNEQDENTSEQPSEEPDLNHDIPETPPDTMELETNYEQDDNIPPTQPLTVQPPTQPPQNNDITPHPPPNKNPNPQTNEINTPHEQQNPTPHIIHFTKTTQPQYEISSNTRSKNQLTTENHTEQK